MCGEKAPVGGVAPVGLGSPPRVRGKAPGRLPPPGLPRITPACAGKRKRARSSARSVEDHPRVCGEKLFMSPLFMLPLGSPPRVRGKVCDKVHQAGAVQDHPRVCGEKCVCVGCVRRSVGSPPRVRGKAGRVQQLGARLGITPACAGKRD